jgi:hypothetical protein
MAPETNSILKRAWGNGPDITAGALPRAPKCSFQMLSRPIIIEKY